jgi:glyoxylase-like metal-dependent hydrolase (beta-lactamase superfamily II)
VPTPFRIGPVNCYLVDAGSLTLLDAGPNDEASLAALERGITGLGHRLEDIELVVLTHQHYDHAGLAHTVAERSGASVAAHRLLVPFLADLNAAMDAEDVYAASLMQLHGVEDDVVAYLRANSARRRRCGHSVEVAVPLDDGDEIQAGEVTLRAFHRPGHSPSDTILVDESTREAVVGDHLLARISSNPIVHRPLEGPVDIRNRTPVLPTYLDSMRQTAALELRALLPGHGPVVTDHRALVERRIAEHEERKARIYEALDRPSSARQLTFELWRELGRDQVYLAVSEVLGHLDLLTEEGRVTAEEDAGLFRFARA